MNSLNILQGLTTTPPSTPPRSRTSSSANVETLSSQRRSHDESNNFDSLSEKLDQIQSQDFANRNASERIPLDEESPLLNPNNPDKPKSTGGWRIHRRIADAVVYSVKVVYNTITAPGRYVIACFYDEHGRFSALLPIRNFKNLMLRKRRKQSAAAVGLDSEHLLEAREEKAQRRTSHQRSPSVDTVSSVSTYANSDTEPDLEKRDDSPARHTRSKTAAAAAGLEKDEIRPQNKSIRIKLHNEEALMKRRAQKARSRGNPDDVERVASSLKSPPSGVTTKMTRYPRTPAPPRPLVPRRQPSYSMSYSTESPKKTLIIDLDETLIHSMAKGGRMSTGHMVEVRLGGPVSSSGVSLGPGVPILYYVHERPNCHEFLRKVCKWYNLIVFTASVQEYADPVIDWLERERKYFSGRYYRQHCTFRNGAYIKDLAQVEPDLSRVMILDNSPMSYIFHEGMFYLDLQAIALTDFLSRQRRPHRRLDQRSHRPRTLASHPLVRRLAVRYGRSSIARVEAGPSTTGVASCMEYHRETFRIPITFSFLILDYSEGAAAFLFVYHRIRRTLFPYCTIIHLHELIEKQRCTLVHLIETSKTPTQNAPQAQQASPA
jgi:CTD nuclear envelope phosphatase 1